MPPFEWAFTAPHEQYTPSFESGKTYKVKTTEKNKLAPFVRLYNAFKFSFRFLRLHIILYTFNLQNVILFAAVLVNYESTCSSIQFYRMSSADS